MGPRKNQAIVCRFLLQAILFFYHKFFFLIVCKGQRPITKSTVYMIVKINKSTNEMKLYGKLDGNYLRKI